MAGAVAGAAAALLALGNSTAEYRNQQAMLATAFDVAGGSAEVAKETYNDLFRVLGDSGQATEAAQHLAKLTTEEQALSEWTNICQGVYATFGESLPIEGLAEAANHTAKVGEVQGVLADALEWSGVSLDDFNARLLLCNDESEREKLIRETLNGLYSESAAKYEETNAAVLAQNEAQSKMNEAMAKLGEVTAPIMTMLTELGATILADLTPYLEEFAAKYLPDIQEALSGVGEAIGKVFKWIADNWELVSTIAAIITGIAVALSLVSTALSIYNTIMAITSVVSAPVIGIIALIVAAIAALVAIIVLVIKYWDEIKAATLACWNAIVNAVKAAIDWIIQLFTKIFNWVKENWQGLLLLLVNPFAGAFKLLYDNCEGFRNFINNFLEKVKNAVKAGFDWIKEKMITPIQNAFNKVKEFVNKIKGLFKFEWSLPKLKVPKFSITPSGWGVGDLLKGVIPKLGITWNARGGVFDKPTVFGYGGSLQGIGENGAEAVVPLENNLEWLNKLADMLAGKLGTGTPVVLQVDGKTFARTTINALNNNTRQTGKLGINLV